MQEQATGCEGPHCRNLVEQQPGGHRRRRFCSNDCKQRAYRERVHEREEQRVRECGEQRQAAQRKDAVSAQQLENDLNAIRIDVVSPDLLSTSYGQALVLVKDREQEIAHLKTRISKQLERKIQKQQARIEDLEGMLEKHKADAKELAHVEKVPTTEDLTARFHIVGERLHYRRLLAPHIEPGAEAWQHFIEHVSSSSPQLLSQAVTTAEHYFENLTYLDELEQRARTEARAKQGMIVEGSKRR